MIDSNGVFHGTDWLRLETAIDIIGDMIAYYCALEASPSTSPEKAKIYELKIEQLGKERQLCYDSKRNSEIIIKAYNEYGPFLKDLSSRESNQE